MRTNKITIITFVIALSLFIGACGLTPVKKEATRKKVHTKDRPTIEESRDIKPSKERNVKKAKEVIKTTTINSKLIFSSNRTGNLEIWLSDVDGENAIQLTTDDEYESHWPRVSSDRNKVLFYRAPKGTNENALNQFSLWQLNLQDQSTVELIPKGSYGWQDQSAANWSPDGTKIVMAATEANGLTQIFITDSNGKNPTKISTRKSLYLDPSWSPDGSKITYASIPNNSSESKADNLEIFITNADGSNEQQLTFDNLQDRDPYWSPDGKSIAFDSEIQPLYWLLGKWAIRTTDLNSGETSELINDGHSNLLPRWNSDSKFIYFHRLQFKEDKKYGLWKIDADGSNLTKIHGSDRYKAIQADIY